MKGLLIVARLALRESLRRRVFAVVLVLSAAFLGLYAWGAAELFEDVSGFGGNEFGVESDTLAGGTVLGLSMFVTLFLGAVLSTFLTLGAVRGDAERGLLQPLIVRPVGRPAYLAGRLLTAGAVTAGYVVVLFGACVVIVNRGAVVTAGAPSDLARPRGVEVETAGGPRLFQGAGRDDAPRIVAELVAAGDQVYGVRVLRSTLEDVYVEAVS